MSSLGKITGFVPVDAFLRDVELILRGHDFVVNDGETARHVALVRVTSVALRALGACVGYRLLRAYFPSLFITCIFVYDCTLVGHRLSQGIEAHNSGPGVVSSLKRGADTVTTTITGRHIFEESFRGTVTAEVIRAVRSFFSKDGI